MPVEQANATLRVQDAKLQRLRLSSLCADVTF